MLNKVRSTIKASYTRKRPLFVVGCTLLLGCLVLIFVFLTQPQRTVANFCSTAKEEKAILVGNVNYRQRLDAYKRLEAVSPDAIQPDITIIRKGYEDIVSNPSDTLSAGLGMSGAENRRSAYINANCPNF